MSTAPSPSDGPTAVSFFLHCPRCAAPRKGDGGDSRFLCAGCGFTYYFNVASAVAVFIEDAEGRCLFIRRARPPAEGKLALPGGFTDAHETGETACRREIIEELGIELGPLAWLGSWPNRYHAGGFVVPVLDLFFRASVIDAPLRPAEEEVSATLWLRPEEVDPADLAFPSMRHALAAYLKRQ